MAALSQTRFPSPRFGPATFIAALAISGLTVCSNPAACDVIDCNYFASPSGKGDGSSPANAFRIATFWKSARPGMTLCLLDGKYVGVDSMISPPRDLAGRDSAPI